MHHGTPVPVITWGFLPFALSSGTGIGNNYSVPLDCDCVCMSETLTWLLVRQCRTAAAGTDEQSCPVTSRPT